MSVFVCWRLHLFLRFALSLYSVVPKFSTCLVFWVTFLVTCDGVAFKSKSSNWSEIYVETIILNWNSRKLIALFQETSWPSWKSWTVLCYTLNWQLWHSLCETYRIVLNFRMSKFSRIVIFEDFVEIIKICCTHTHCTPCVKNFRWNIFVNGWKFAKFVKLKSLAPCGIHVLGALCHYNQYAVKSGYPLLHWTGIFSSILQLYPPTPHGGL